MLNKCISTSETVNSLSFEAMTLYTWSISHSDDVGLIPYSAKKLKAIICPMWDMTMETFGIHVESIVKSGLWIETKWENEKFYYVTGHPREQTLKRDRPPSSIASNIKDWNQVEDIWNQLEPSGSISKVKLSKDKRSKDKGKEKSTREEKHSGVNAGAGYTKAKQVRKTLPH